MSPAFLAPAGSVPVVATTEHGAPTDRPGPALTASAPTGAEPVDAPAKVAAPAVPAAETAGRAAKPRLEIEYCTRCRWLPRAAWLAQELLTTFENDLAAVSLVPGTGGVFAVRVDGAVIWDRRDQGFPEPTAVKRAVRDLVAPGRSLGHSDA